MCTTDLIVSFMTNALLNLENGLETGVATGIPLFSGRFQPITVESCLQKQGIWGLKRGWNRRVAVVEDCERRWRHKV